jgi:hypothetical protein
MREGGGGGTFALGGEVAVAAADGAVEAPVARCVTLAHDVKMRLVRREGQHDEVRVLRKVIPGEKKGGGAGLRDLAVDDVDEVGVVAVDCPRLADEHHDLVLPLAGDGVVGEYDFDPPPQRVVGATVVDVVAEVEGKHVHERRAGRDDVVVPRRRLHALGDEKAALAVLGDDFALELTHEGGGGGGGGTVSSSSMSRAERKRRERCWFILARGATPSRGLDGEGGGMPMAMKRSFLGLTTAMILSMYFMTSIYISSSVEGAGCRHERPSLRSLRRPQDGTRDG